MSDIPKLSLISSGKYKNIILILSIVSLIGLGFAGYSYYQFQKTQKELQTIKKTAVGTSQNATNDQLAKILSEVGKLIKLPEGEVPTMATISDIAKLKEQPFFQNGKNGDILLVFNKAGKAILYNPTDKKIVEVAPVNNANTSVNASGSPKLSPTPTPIQFKILLRNGTLYPNLAGRIEGDIKKSYPGATIVGKENAARNTYDKSILVLLNQAFKDGATDVAKTLGISIADIPSAEKKPSGVDILIILGKDKI